MNEPLAAILAERLRTLPFADRVAGLVRPVEQRLPDGERTIVNRYPYPVNLPVKTCDNSDFYLLPSPETASIHFFEDGGSRPYEFQAGVKGFESSLRLLGWLNPNRLTLPLSDARWQAAVLEALNGKLPTSVYRNLFIQARTLSADAGLWNKYTYNDKLLYYPYQLLGLELTCRYVLDPKCLTDPLPSLKEPGCVTFVDPSVPQYNQQQYTPQEYA